MSNALTIGDRSNPVSTPAFSGRRFWMKLLFKELRETGYFALMIMVASLAFIFLGSQLYAWTGWFRQIDFASTGAAGFCTMVPLMIVMACGSATFCMEHENRSIGFLRSLPVSAFQIFWSKLFVLGFVTSLSCIIFWPIAFYGINTPLLYLQPIDQSKYPVALSKYTVTLGEAAIWAIFFSLREKKVLIAVLKASIGFFVISKGPSFIAYANIHVQERTVALDRFDFFTRTGIAIFLTCWIAYYAHSWLRDRNSGSVLPEFRFLRRSIQSDRLKPFAWLRRLVWLQFQTVGVPLVLK